MGEIEKGVAIIMREVKGIVGWEKSINAEIGLGEVNKC